jgi:hypothetical protein
LFAEYFCRKTQKEGLSQNLAAIEENVQKSIAFKKKKSSEKEKVDIVGKKKEKFSNNKGKVDENFSVGQSFSEMKENIEKKENKEDTEDNKKKQEKKKIMKRKIWMYS